jgi:hypothetical protein
VARTKSDLELKAERINYQGDLALHNLQCMENGGVISEEYSNGHMSFQLHVGSVRPYALEYFAASACDVGLTTAFWANEFPVLVWVGNIAQGLRPVDSLVRLVRLDSIDVSIREVSQWPILFKSTFPVFDEFVFSADRELCSYRIGVAGILSRQLENQIVQRGAKIMNAITDDQRKLRRERRFGSEDDIRLVPNVVIIDNDIIRLARGVSLNCNDQIAKMFIGAFDPFTSAVERVSHIE